MEQIIYLDATDDLPMIRDRLEWAQSRRVLLVLPKGYEPLRSPVGLRLLLRHAAATGVEIALVTRDRITIELARERGIAIFSSVERGQRARKLTQADLDEVAPGPTRRFTPSLRLGSRPQAGDGPGRLRQLGVALILVAVVGVMLAGVALLVFPSANVLLHLPAVDVSETIAIQADVAVQEADAAKSAIPARELSVEITGDARTNVTTQRDVPDAKATGEIVFTNKTESEVTLAPGVVLATSTGVTVRFQTVETVTVPAGLGERATAKIEALEAGLGGNVRAFVINRIEGVASVQVSAVNEDPTTGGTMKSVLVVGNEDKTRVRSLLLQRLQQEAQMKLREQLQEQEFLLPETVAIIPTSEVYDKFVDEPAEEIGLHIIAVVKGLAISGKDANNLALDALEAQVPEGMALIPTTLRFQPGEVKEFADGRVIFMMTASGSASPVVDESEIVQNIRGKPLSWAEQYLQEHLELDSEPVIELHNGWLGRLPILSVRIGIETLPAE